MQLLIGTSIRRYAPPIGTAGFARLLVRGYKRVPAPPPRIIAPTELESPCLTARAGGVAGAASATAVATTRLWLPVHRVNLHTDIASCSADVGGACNRMSGDCRAPCVGWLAVSVRWAKDRAHQDTLGGEIRSVQLPNIAGASELSQGMCRVLDSQHQHSSGASENWRKEGTRSS